MTSNNYKTIAYSIFCAFVVFGAVFSMPKAVYGQSCTCPSWYSLTVNVNAETVCEREETQPLIDNTWWSPIIAQDWSQHAAFTSRWLVLYPFDYIITPPTSSMYSSESGFLTGWFFQSLWTIQYGRQNNISVTSNPQIDNELHGFSICVTVPADGEYLITGSADDEFMLSINWEPVLETYDWYFWYATYLSQAYRRYYTRAVYLSSWSHIIEAQFINYWGPGWFVSELIGPFPTWTFIDSNTNTQRSEQDFANEILASWTWTYTLERSWLTVDAPLEWTDNVIWSTADEIGSQFTLWESFGFSCPDGYAVNVDTNACWAQSCIRKDYVSPTCSSWWPTDPTPSWQWKKSSIPQELPVICNDKNAINYTNPWTGQVVINNTLCDYSDKPSDVDDGSEERTDEIVSDEELIDEEPFDKKDLDKDDHRAPGSSTSSERHEDSVTISSAFEPLIINWMTIIEIIRKNNFWSQILWATRRVLPSILPITGWFFR